MKVAGKVTPKLRARVLELRREKLSYRVICATLESEGTPLSHVMVFNLCKAAEGVPTEPVQSEGERGAEPGMARVRGKGAGRRGTGGAGGAGAGTGKGAASGEEPSEEAISAPMRALPAGASAAAVACWEDLREIRQTASELRAKVVSGDYPATQWATLKGLALRHEKALDELLPPTPPDPANDPTNIGAREAIHASVLKVIEGAEARLGLLCARCCAEVEG